jgi:hypothetical protein
MLIPTPAHAYLLPLIGASGAIATMLIGLGAALLSALYLLFYNMARFFRKKNGVVISDDEEENT